MYVCGSWGGSGGATSNGYSIMKCENRRWNASSNDENTKIEQK